MFAGKSIPGGENSQCKRPEVKAGKECERKRRRCSQSRVSKAERRGGDCLLSLLPAAWRPWVLLRLCTLVLTDEQACFRTCRQWPPAERPPVHCVLSAPKYPHYSHFVDEKTEG